jgi:hypothetical protein
LFVPLFNRSSPTVTKKVVGVFVFLRALQSNKIKKMAVSFTGGKAHNQRPPRDYARSLCRLLTLRRNNQVVEGHKSVVRGKHQLLFG